MNNNKYDIIKFEDGVSFINNFVIYGINCLIYGCVILLRTNAGSLYICLKKSRTDGKVDTAYKSSYNIIYYTDCFGSKCLFNNLNTVGIFNNILNFIGV